MAAEAVTSVVTEGIISKLISLVADEIGLAWGLKGQLRKLRKTLVGIQNVLQEAELRQEKSKNVKDWLMRLKEVAYEADDILDEYATEVLRRKIEIGNNMKKECNFLSPCSNPVAFHNWDTIVGEIGKTLEGKRYLLVLDDVWKEDDNDEQWSRLLTSCLSGDGVTRGSKILVTTRSEKVASMMGGKPLMHRLKGLSDEDCWSIFKRRAFGGGVVDVGRDKNIIVADDDLVEIGMELVKKCKGVPLAAKALGGLMCNKRSKEEWVSVRETLKLSYDDLPYYLKQCFAYCSVFPKGDDLYKEALKRQWIALGFVVREDNDEVSLEDTAEEYFNSLLGRSFFQDVEISESTGEIYA
uniref:Disease resistance protein RGA3 n=1 Tax=Nelumbo nucifera TaxID=4432 RepID=A0A822ZN96_NELNU|nr:TPA_asm: hypothetical protein HUJ06_004473 [Nelumbo nucifera]